jgi:hypothetical protein
MRIDLPDDQWWDIKEHLTVGDEEFIDEQETELSMKSIVRLQGSGLDIAALTAGGAGTDQKVQAVQAKVSIATKNLTVLRGTIAWSFGEVSAEGLRERSKRNRDKVWGAMVVQYGLGETLEELEAGKDSSGVLSSTRNGQ